tara:strand:- start:960 stop:1955 length:996 start_codon:yes stop_codon:yes gene_type:complete
MPKIINYIQPYKVNSVKDIKDFLVFTKNALRIINKKACYKQNVNSILVPTRWSKKLNCWVVDMCTDLKRDIDGLTKENIDNFYEPENIVNKAVCNILNAVNNNKRLYDIGLKNHLVKNETKVIIYMYTDDLISKATINPIGIFQFQKSKKRKGVDIFRKNITVSINNTKKFVKEVANTSDQIENLEYLYIDDYNSIYLNFLDYIKSKKIEITTNNSCITFEFEKILKDKLFKLDDVKDLSLLKRIVNSNVRSENIVYTNKSKIIKLYLSIYLSDFLKTYFCLNENEYIVFWEKHMSNYIKLVGKEILESNPINKEESNTDIDYQLMLPRFL